MRDKRISRRMHQCLMVLFNRAAREIPEFPERHDWAEGEVGEASTRRMSYRQMQHCIDQLKYLLGDRPRPPRRYWLATQSQLVRMRKLSGLVPWSTSGGLVSWVRRQLSELRRRAWDGRMENLSRLEASKVIEGLQEVIRYEAGRCRKSAC